MNINKIEKVKLLYLLNNNEEKVNTILKFRKNLTPKWFEYYVKYFFEKIEWYKCIFNSEKVTHKDDWIDIKWIKWNKWNKKLLIVQCKRWSNKKTTVNDIRSFYWWIAKIVFNNPNTNIYYITTSDDITNDALNFWDENGIMIKDYRNILKMNDIYSLKEFKKDIEENEKEIESFFNYKQLNLIDVLNENINIDKRTINSKTKEILKIIREKIAKENQMFLYEVCKNNTIDLLVKNRPHNLESLKLVLSQNIIDFRERKKLEKYWNEFIKWLVLLDS